VIPLVGPIRVQVEVGALSEALETIAAQLESEHPVDPNGGHTYQPLVEMRLSGTEQTLVLLTTDRMGYSAKEGVGIEGVEGLPSKVAWTFSAAVDIRLEPEDIVFHTKVNHGYLRQIVAALEMSDEEELVLCFIAPDKVIMLTPAERQDAKALLMPCRMEVVAA
jgi:hypothetical protein